MSNTPKLEGINSVCTTPEELIKSEDFMSGIIEKAYILSLFTKLQSGEALGDEEREDLNSFVSDSKVPRLNNIFAQDGLVQSYVRKVAQITDSTLDEYTGMRLLNIKVNGKETEVWMDERNLRVDSSKWSETKIGHITVKINPEGDITEYLGGGELAGEQLFTWDAAMREAKKLGKRLPLADEFQAIIGKVGEVEFMELLPGYRNTDGSDFWFRGRKSYFWLGSSDGGVALNMRFHSYRGWRQSEHDWGSKDKAYSIRCIKDSNFYSV